MSKKSMRPRNRTRTKAITLKAFEEEKQLFNDLIEEYKELKDGRFESKLTKSEILILLLNEKITKLKEDI